MFQEYVEKEKEFSRLYTDYKELITYVFNGTFHRKPKAQLINKNEEQREDLTEKLYNLALRISMTEQLISELEYMFRKIPVEDTNTQLSIISKHLVSYVPIVETYDIIDSYGK